ncbi:hypothetical protein H2O64_04440 [Kordia sp. YSTF-M3]|uniref:Bacteriocin n=1 Tax=Kordia aestuariivivens TaxID=2759037 RepID=A0ABR7Q6C9_9FLAO|nr:hypothetical protein [Kordia aestuariivivens]MBC8753906.1 hypothetical protein [Kordia aestuariivivens]
MKKKNLKSLNLNKKSISKLNDKSIKGGYSFTALTPILVFTEGNCVETIGDDSCTGSLLCNVGW